MEQESDEGQGQVDQQQSAGRTGGGAANQVEPFDPTTGQDRGGRETVPRGTLRRHWSAVVSALLGASGAGLLGCAAVSALLADPPETSRAVPTVAAGSVFAAPVTGPAEVELNGQLCVVVENVVSPTEFAEADDAVALARSDLAAARAALTAAKAVEANAAEDQRAAAVAKLQRSTEVARDAQAALVAAKSARQALDREREIELLLNGTAAPVRLVAKATGTARPQRLDFALGPDADASLDQARFWRRLMLEGMDEGVSTLRLWVQLAGQDGRRVDAGDVAFRIYDPGLLRLAGIGLALLLGAFASLAYNTGILREGPAPRAFSQGPWPRYSLALVQTVFWAVIVFAGYIFVWVVTGQYRNVMTTSAFTLIGISGKAYAVSAALGPSVPAGSENRQSRNLLFDLVTGDDGGPQLHRIQVIAWTVVLGMIFLYNIYWKLELTSFDANLLALLGISNGVYLGMKTKEG